MTLFEAMEATWPAAARHRAGAFVVREGRGGGARVSSATAEAPWTDADIASAEACHAALGQPALFQIRPGEEDLDAALAARGHALRDRVILLSAPVAALTGPLPALACFAHWPMLALQRDLWAAGGIGPARIAVMDRVGVPKATLMARDGDRTAGTAFVACAGDIAMLHALYVLSDLRRRGIARQMLCAAANWAAEHGAATLTLAVTADNAAALALYASAGMAEAGRYHFRGQDDA